MIRIGDPFIELTTIDSTNIYAMQQAHARLAKPGTVYFAHEQTAGKGQRNRQWSSEAGKNLTMSAVIEAPSQNPDKQFMLSCAIALACYDFFKAIAGDETTIKWPNDLYWNDRKAGGILIENIIRGNVWELAIAGMGININQGKFDPKLKNPVSLLQITGRNFNILDLAFQLCEHLSDRVHSISVLSSNELLAEYNSRLFKIGKEVKFRKDGRIIKGILHSVDSSGNIYIGNEIPECIAYGAAEWMLE